LRLQLTEQRNTTNILGIDSRALKINMTQMYFNVTNLESATGLLQTGKNSVMTF